MSEIQTYKNWKAVTEADFVSILSRLGLPIFLHYE